MWCGGLAAGRMVVSNGEPPYSVPWCSVPAAKLPTKETPTRSPCFSRVAPSPFLMRLMVL